MNMKAMAFSPGHITGFFTIKDTPASFLDKGSLGAGVSLSHGVKTIVEGVPSSFYRAVVRFNGKEVRDALVSLSVLDIFFKKTGKKPHVWLTIDHEISLPMGSGCGSSGAGALGLSYALNDLFQTGLSPIEAAQIAHQAEVEMKTGLGTVIGETFGGIEIRTKPGAPGIGTIVHIPVTISHKVVVLMFGPLSTKEYLSDNTIREKINNYGMSLVAKIIEQPGIVPFLHYARQFSLETGLVTPEVRELIHICEKKGFIMGMPIFGNGIYTIIEESKVRQLCRILDPYKEKAHLLVSDIDFKGARSLYGD